MLGESSHCEIRPGAPADAPALSEVFRNSWSNAYLGIIPHLHLDSMIRQRTPDWWGATIKSGGELLVLQVAGVIAGYATLGAARVRGDYEGEIYELYVTPTYQGLGFGERLFEACRYHLDGRQLAGLIVWALADNAGASDFYWRRGGRPVGMAFERFGRTKLKKVAFAWE
jgi:ribosomal protein S18 acetylase RimI-like enzyme